MKEERMYILTMLNEGKITADEAVCLLNALASTEPRGFDEFAKSVKEKAVNFAEMAEPKVKKAAKDIKDKSVEVFGSIKGKFKEMKENDNINDAEESEYVIVSDEDEIIDASDDISEDSTEE